MEEFDYSFLKNYPLFGGLLDQQIKVIIPFIKKYVYEKGAMILKEGDSNNKIYFILEGEVEIYKTVKEGKKQLKEQLAILKRGDNFGEMELIEIKNVIASVKALTKTVVLTLTNEDLLKIEKIDLKIFVMLILNLARELSRRLDKLDRIYAQLLSNCKNCKK